MQQLKLDTIKRIVVRGTNWVGDAVMTVPALRELRRLLPDAHVKLAVRSWAEGLFAEADFIDDLMIYDRRGLSSVIQQIRKWRQRSFDLAVLFQNAFEAALIPAVARVPFRIGYVTDGRRALLTNAIPVPEWRSSKHEVFYYLNVVAEIERLLTGRETILGKHKRRNGLTLLVHRDGNRNLISQIFPKLADRADHLIQAGAIVSGLLTLAPFAEHSILVDTLLHDPMRLSDS